MISCLFMFQYTNNEHSMNNIDSKPRFENGMIYLATLSETNCCGGKQDILHIISNYLICYLSNQRQLSILVRNKIIHLHLE